MQHNYHVYILTNLEKTTLYIGVTNSLRRRLEEHRLNPSGFTRKYNCTFLIYHEHFSQIEAAIQREKQLKKWNRAKKELLIEKTNPDWEFLNYQFIEA